QNALGTSAPTVLPLLSLGVPPAPQYVAPAVAPHAPYTPPAVVDISSSSTNAITVSVPGYVSVPQGVVKVAVNAGGDANAMSVTLTGGVLAAWIDLTPTR